MAKRIVVVTGPTAAGKTFFGAELSKRFGGEVVSADSMQVYRRMDIGTAKPTAGETGGVPHHMIDVADPAEDYSVSRFVRDASACADDIISRGKLPFIVGGTGLYIDSLVSGRDFAPRAEDGAVRDKYAAMYDEKGGGELLRLLAEKDPARAEKLHPNDKKRIVRALEVLETSHDTMSEHDERTLREPPRYDAKYIVLGFEKRGDLYGRIDARVDAMMKRGLLAEVRGLLDSGVPRKSTAMQAIGYKELASALLGECSVEEAVEAVKRASRRYAKRQISWCGRYFGACRINWGTGLNFGDGLQISTKFLHENDIL